MYEAVFIGGKMHGSWKVFRELQNHVRIPTVPEPMYMPDTGRVATSHIVVETYSLEHFQGFHAYIWGELEPASPLVSNLIRHELTCHEALMKADRYCRALKKTQSHLLHAADWLEDSGDVEAAEQIRHVLRIAADVSATTQQPRS